MALSAGALKHLFENGITIKRSETLPSGRTIHYADELPGSAMIFSRAMPGEPELPLLHHPPKPSE